jgi:hypothetical protein
VRENLSPATLSGLWGFVSPGYYAVLVHTLVHTSTRKPTDITIPPPLPDAGAVLVRVGTHRRQHTISR